MQGMRVEEKKEEEEEEEEEGYPRPGCMRPRESGLVRHAAGQSR